MTGRRLPPMRALLPGLAGAALLLVPHAGYRIDQMRCPDGPSPGGHVLYLGVYLVAISLLASSWLALARWAQGKSGEGGGPPSLREVLLACAAVHAVALLSGPFLSYDPIYYATVGRAMALYHADPHASLCKVLPADDPFLAGMSALWRCGDSPYGPAWNWLSAGVAWLARDRLWVALRLFQLVAAGAVLGAAAVAGVAARQAGGEPGDGGRAVALVGACPLAIVEGSVNAHNDAVLCLAAAVFALCVVRRRPLLAAAALLLAATVKASALLLLSFYVVFLVLRALGRRLPGGLLALALASAAALLGLAAILLLPPSLLARTGLLRLLGSPTAAYPDCTRSFECAIRGFLIFVVHAPRASWITGLVFRFLGGLWLLHAAARAAREDRPLPFAAAFLFIYYLFLHGFSTGWYFLPLLPLLPYAPRRLYPAMLVCCVSQISHYVAYMPLICLYDWSHVVPIAVSEVLQGAIAVLPAVYAIVRSRRR